MNFYLIGFRMHPGAPFKSLKKTLEEKYLEAHSASNSGSYRKFIQRCIRLAGIRGTISSGLKYIVFSHTLVSRAEQLGGEWKIYEKELEDKGVFRHIDELVDHHCPDWYHRLQNLFPHWDLGSPKPAADRLFEILQGIVTTRERYDILW